MPRSMSESERKRDLLRARIALDKLKKNNDAIEKIVDILKELPDWESRRSVISYLHSQLERIEAGQ